ncbi:activator of Hsp90 ATPase-like protein [Pseudomonas sp. SJZ085]|nr:activator of Hsp90 ATPase-like protein [Pseudomonas sp. SJZ075]TWC11868.1 activator of Hsp90 ATPase-like protein [Pseudomonas sp. SJZ074]TWC25458.1 activator of Hsp90 ATPase-like protein [Pseudomonas sp. SJZ078]TWC38706.1 activator of Hsp90 ATPase-like protein [Pseudomonas sp. SJZ085]TWC44847.1 activator of Hsp90 ATPase-like protein [Pseudomonas sp. SJZ124]TWC80355.1 activator of Hsp90 ATPase-like protein [Pseudomonas sp. SJZ101]
MNLTPAAFELSISRLIDARRQQRFRAFHWSEEERQAHEAMGFHDGWGQSLGRLDALVTQGMPD